MCKILLHEYDAEENTIKLETRTGTTIDNKQCFKLNNIEVIECQKYDGDYRFRPGIVFRTKAIPLYNCHGLTFASRRTGISKTPAINAILKDDKYSEIKNISEVLPGDVIIYFSSDGDAEHSGIVLEPQNSTDCLVPVVLSKWGSYREVIHPANLCPYEYNPQLVKYFRIKE